MEEDNINAVLDAFVSSLRHFKPHRVGVQHPTNGITNIISQTDLITFASKHIQALSLTTTVG